MWAVLLPNRIPAWLPQLLNEGTGTSDMLLRPIGLWRLSYNNQACYWKSILCSTECPHAEWGSHMLCHTLSKILQDSLPHSMPGWLLRLPRDTCVLGHGARPGFQQLLHQAGITDSWRIKTSFPVSLPSTLPYSYFSTCWSKHFQTGWRLSELDNHSRFLLWAFASSPPYLTLTVTRETVAHPHAFFSVDICA